MTISTIPSLCINSELERLFVLQTNDEKVGKIKLFLRDEKTKRAKWSKDEYYRLLRLIESCDSQFRSKDGRIEKERIKQLINSIAGIQSFQIQEIQRQPREKVQRII
jgi:hypothetical protein